LVPSAGGETTSIAAEFCDTNILAYAHDRSAGRKHEVALSLVTRLWDDGGGLLSVQVLQELFVTLTNRTKVAMDSQQARGVIAAFSAWRVYSPSVDDVLTAIDAARGRRISFWDSMILVAAKALGAAVVWSEDLNHGQAYDGVSVRNPFLAEVA
jgi:predicted nucleic acid-binding protein